MIPMQGSSSEAKPTAFRPAYFSNSRSPRLISFNEALSLCASAASFTKSNKTLITFSGVEIFESLSAIFLNTLTVLAVIATLSKTF